MPETKTTLKKGRFSKIPKEFLLSPGGILLLFLILIFELLDLVLPDVIPGIFSLSVEMIPDLIIAAYLVLIAGVSVKSVILPFLIERIPIISDILPTWLIRLFV